ncbi:Hepatocyte growth factor-like protein (Partial), partial [Seminavis robusta]|eukprot:Sro1675_g290390.1 Hepatocyte growth factor-like protein (501) ;mRNA; r:2-1506
MPSPDTTSLQRFVDASLDFLERWTPIRRQGPRQDAPKEYGSNHHRRHHRSKSPQRHRRHESPRKDRHGDKKPAGANRTGRSPSPINGVARKQPHGQKDLEEGRGGDDDDLLALKYVRARMETMASDSDASSVGENQAAIPPALDEDAEAKMKARPPPPAIGQQQSAIVPQRPGAYKGAPGEGLQRNSDVRYSRINVPLDLGSSSKIASFKSSYTTTTSSPHNQQSSTVFSSSMRAEEPGALASIPDYDNIPPPTEPLTIPAESNVMISATLVENEDVVTAEKAPEDFEALRQNSKTKYVMACILMVLLALGIPMVVVLTTKKTEEILVRPNITVLICGTASTNQADYRGRQNTSETGIPCQRWDSQFPNSHNYSPERFPDANLSENYCRNPNGASRAWCIANTAGGPTRKLDCDVPFCDAIDGTINVNLCGTLRGKRQSDYRGTINVTNQGVPCLPWSMWQYADQYAGLEENYCRNPTQESAAWCFAGNQTTPEEVFFSYC